MCFFASFLFRLLQHVFRLPSNHNWQSVADRINELEKQQQKQQQATHDHSKQNYTFLDPSKTHKVPNPTLKAFQKNAIQSYFERQQQLQQSLRLSKTNHHGNGNKSDDLTKKKSIGGLEMSKSNGNIASRPQSLNLSIATSAVSLPTTPSCSSTTSSSAGSQRSSLSAWPSPTTANQSIMIGSKASDSAAMMKNANDIAKMNMKNSAMSSAAAALSEKQLFAANKGNNGKINQSINKNLFTSFCEIKTENHPYDDNKVAANNKTNATPPPLPRKSVLRRYLSCNY